MASSFLSRVSDRTRGWLYVGAQAVLLVLLVLIPSDDHWPTPGTVRALSSISIVVGLGLVLAASLRLGRALTPTPVPNGRGTLQTGGLIGVATFAFFNSKARWEESQLLRTFPDYASYAQRTARFFPHPRRGGTVQQ